MDDVLPASRDPRRSYPQPQPPPGRPSRRGLLAAGAAALVAAGSGTAAYALWREVTDTPAPSPGPTGAVRVEQGRFVSRHRGPTGYAVIRPPASVDSDDLPVVIALHGLGGDHARLVGPRFQLDGALGRVVRDGVPPFRVVTVDAGNTYYHPHHGEDAGAMVLEELLPLLARQRLATRRHDRIGLLGWSMGGYGALRLAGILGPRRVAAVCAVSPALWLDPREASVHGFDGPGEYLRYSVIGHQHELDGIPVRIDCGLSDPFLEAAQAYAAGFDRPVETSFEPGAHLAGYWRRVLPAELTFLGSTLAG